jgi:hypothetical protein
MLNNDLRVSEWANLLDLSPDNSIIILGEPPIGTEEGLKRLFSSVNLFQDFKKQNVLNFFIIISAKKGD